ncbi:MAG: sigma-70 family RNA polymerase sigma factor [Flavobacteriaceae bacterium]|nr:sigma-70 family RNA polymerase sigma factor [Flavobacteriaceae bacterium]
MYLKLFYFCTMAIEKEAQQLSSVCEEKVFRDVFDEHSQTIRNFIFYKCGDMQQAEDITQDAFVKLWEHCKKVVFGKAKSFVMKIAQNIFFNQAKHEKIVLSYAKQAKTQMFGYSPEFIMEEKEFMEKLTRCIGALPVRQREVFLLSRKDKKTYKEIAEIVGVSQKAVEHRMHLALLELRKKIGIKI